jgi:hypothetical protein
MDVGDNAELVIATIIPERNKTGTVKSDNPRV